MKKIVVALASLVMVLALSACEGSASSAASSEDSSENKGASSENKEGTSESKGNSSQDSGSVPDNSGKVTTSQKGSFPVNGDPNFYCDVTSGEGWAQIKVNIPNYMGHVEKIGYDPSTDTGTQYYEEAFYRLTSFEKSAMCLEYDEEFKNDKTHNVTDYYCGEGVFYMVVTAENVGGHLDEFTTAEEDFRESCERYQRKWDEGEYDEAIERRM